MMLFSGEHTAPVHDVPLVEFGEDEAAERTYEIVEALSALMIEREPSWDRIEALAGELRLIARAVTALADPKRDSPETTA